MNKKKRLILIGCCLIMFSFICVIPLLNRVFLLTVKYNVEGQNIDCSQACKISLHGFDGVKSCWGYCINMQDKKIYCGIDFKGLSYVSLHDGCRVNGEFVDISYDLEFPEKTVHRFWKETVFLNFKYDDAGKIYGTVNSFHNTHYPDNELIINDEAYLLDKVVPLEHNQTLVHLRF